MTKPKLIKPNSFKSVCRDIVLGSLFAAIGLFACWGWVFLLGFGHVAGAAY